MWTNVVRSSAERCRQSASRAASCLDGLRSSASIRRMVTTAQPTCAASSSRVKSSALRRRRTQVPNEYSSLMDFSKPECDTQRLTRADQTYVQSCSKAT